jgi:hypothetical protein
MCSEDWREYMKTMKFVTASSLLALGAFAIPALAAQLPFGGKFGVNLGVLVANLVHGTTASLVAMPDVGSIVLLGTGLLSAGTFIRVRRSKVER